MNGTITPGAVVLVDTNAIIEAHRTRTWAALTGAYSVETVEDCVTETQTGYQSRDRDRWIEVSELKATLRVVHEVSDRERAELAVRVNDIALDRGEESLWAHALGRTETWFLCGPDRASLRMGIRLKLRDRLVSLEELLDRVGHRSLTLRPPYTRQWTDGVLNEMVLAELGRR